jgi:lysophospholipase L1-like esterase
LSNRPFFAERINVKFSYRALLASAAAAVAVAGAVEVTTAAAASAATTRARPAVYYVSLGDSLSVGDQPNGSGALEPTRQGYSNDLYSQLKTVEARHGKSLKLVELGCAGETSRTMIKGGTCSYAGAGSQLTAAEQFLSAHRGQVALVTLSIGANDVDACATTAGIDTACVEQGLETLETNLGTITAGLKKADPSPATKYAGIDLYDPFLADWLSGSAGQTLATESVTLTGDVNGILEDGYSRAGFKVGDVARAFKITEFSPMVPLPGTSPVPLNVALTCKLTWMCAAAPVGPNIHPDAAGYALIARALSTATGIGRA